MEFRKKLKEVRNIIGYSQEQLARELGVSFATVNRWENGKSEPRQIQKSPGLFRTKALAWYDRNAG